MHKWLSSEARRAQIPWRRAVLGAIVAAGCLAPVGSQALPAGCAFAPRCPQHVAQCDAAVPELRAVDKNHQARCILVP